MTNEKNRKIGSLIAAATIVVQVFISISLTPYILNTVGERQYGLYSFALSLTSWLSTLLIAVGSGYYRFLTREYAKKGSVGEQKVIGTFFKIFAGISLAVLILGTFLMVLLFFGVIPLNEYSSSEKNMIILICSMSIISVCITTLLTCYKSFFYYKQKYILIYSLDLCVIILQTILSFYFLHMGFDITFVAGSHFVSITLFSVIQTIYSIIKLRCRPVIKNSSPEEKMYQKQITKEIFIFSSFVILNTVTDIFNKDLDKIILGFTHADSVALYQISFNLVSYLISFTKILSVVSDKKLNETYLLKNDFVSGNKQFLKISNNQTWMTFLIIGGFASCGQAFINWWLGESFSLVYFITLILMGLYSFGISMTSTENIRRILNVHKITSVIHFIALITNLIISILFIFILGKENSLFACLIGTAITTLTVQWIILPIYDTKITKLNIKKHAFNYFTIACISVACVLVVLGCDNIIPLNNLGNLEMLVIQGLIFVTLFLFSYLIVKKVVSK